MSSPSARTVVDLLQLRSESFSASPAARELEGIRVSRIALYAPLRASVDRETEWDTYRNWILDNLGPFRTVFQPRIDQLEPYEPVEVE